LRLQISLYDTRGVAAESEIVTGSTLAPTVWLGLPKARIRRWGPGRPRLYGLRFTLTDPAGTVLDKAESYAGLRGIAIDGTRVLINGEFVFQRLVLDQGFYPNGILTAPDDAALGRDIALSLAAGFNGARLHQKVFEERFLYHADRLGYLVWGEFPDWPPLGYFRSPGSGTRPETHHLAQWLEVIERDYSHPCIIGWCPLNETAWQADAVSDGLRHATRALFLATKQADPTRPVIDASGFAHTVTETDLFDLHDYEQDPEKLRARFARGPDAVGAQPTDARAPNVPYRSQPLFLSEFGGARWPAGAQATASAWGYGDGPKTAGDFLERFGALCRVAREVPGMTGYCYTQLTDVFQEENGLYTFDRQPKFEPARLRAAQDAAADAAARRVS
jgi:beta-galactosidase/beta-glucuronidase